MATQQLLQDDLVHLGLQAGDIVMVHASMRAVGPLDGRAAALVQALLAVLGEQGTLLAYVDYEPTADMPYFDPQRSPAQAGYGVLAEVVRTWPGAYRSGNPGASMAAIGRQASWMCADHPLNYGYGPGSPLAKLVQAKGKVLLLGSHLDHVTLLHYAEHLADLSDKRVIRVREQILRDGAIVEVDIEEYDTGDPVVGAMPESYFGDVIRSYISTRGIVPGPVGNAERCYLFDAADLVAFAVDKMEKEFGLRINNS